MRTVQTLSSHDAQQLVSTVLAELTARGAKGVVAVVDHHGELLAFVGHRCLPRPLPSTRRIVRHVRANRHATSAKRCAVLIRASTSPTTAIVASWAGVAVCL
jgi:hypothetical protein